MNGYCNARKVYWCLCSGVYVYVYVYTILCHATPCHATARLGVQACARCPVPVQGSRGSRGSRVACGLIDGYKKAIGTRNNPQGTVITCAHLSVRDSSRHSFLRSVVQKYTDNSIIISQIRLHSRGGFRLQYH